MGVGGVGGADGVVWAGWVGGVGGPRGVGGVGTKTLRLRKEKSYIYGKIELQLTLLRFRLLLIARV